MLIFHLVICHLVDVIEFVRSIVLGCEVLKLNDKDIRSALISRLVLAGKKPFSVIEELPVERGRAIADVVAVYKILHCYEIKSDLDSLQRLERQVSFYNRSFQKITIVVTKKYLEKVFQLIPDFWGVIEAYKVSGDVKLRYIRPAGLNDEIVMEAVLMGLWREELDSVYFGLYGCLPSKGCNKEKIINSIGIKSKSQILKLYSECMKTRNQRKSDMMYSK